MRFTHRDIVRFARSLVGVRYELCGRSTSTGLDCIGLIVVVAQKFGQNFEDTIGYPAIADGTLTAKIDRWFYAVPHDCPSLPGDFGLFWTDARTKAAQHLAFLDGNRMIHADIHVLSVVEHDFTPKWKKRLLKLYRFKGVDE